MLPLDEKDLRIFSLEVAERANPGQEKQGRIDDAMKIVKSLVGYQVKLNCELACKYLNCDFLCINEYYPNDDNAEERLTHGEFVSDANPSSTNAHVSDPLGLAPVDPETILSVDDYLANLAINTTTAQTG
ncbi:uncharacterized protein LOC112536934 [Ricinus communis]|uniref:Uncharacterized protein n=1 Tax=Ricinus communis TaxID=3988 RepID=B9T692_RICCO|nr:uncharacterized protein LOC112536934 [Ricinus communis]EEF28620.1 conserved hypothetical protein [Ricinus communis]